jgi:hypothetical protein
MARRNAHSLVLARQEKRARALRRQSAAAKRTKLGQSLKKQGITSEISTEGLTIERSIPVDIEIKPKKIIERKLKIKKRRIKKSVRKKVKDRKKYILKSVGTGIVSRGISLRHEANLTGPIKFSPELDNIAREAFGHGFRSTAIVTYEYQPETRRLILHWWKDWKRRIPGPKYAYLNVPEAIYIELVQASSKGRYIYYNIRTSFKFIRLTR